MQQLGQRTYVIFQIQHLREGKCSFYQTITKEAVDKEARVLSLGQY